MTHSTTNTLTRNPIIIIGMGELGSVFARGFLRLGFPVQGVLRDDNINDMAQAIPNPSAVMMSVGEADIHQAIKNCPTAWLDKIIFIQNELLPRDWENSRITNPTVISVWFEKKKGMDSKVVMSSPVFGAKSQMVVDALNQVDLPCHALDTSAELNYELVRKNLYILTTNISGLLVGGNVTTLETEYVKVMRAVASEVLDIQDWLTGDKNERAPLMAGLLEAFKGDPEHGCMGRSASARLARALSYADDAGLSVDLLKTIKGVVALNAENPK